MESNFQEIFDEYLLIKLCLISINTILIDHACMIRQHRTRCPLLFVQKLFLMNKRTITLIHETIVPQTSCMIYWAFI